MPRRLSSLPGRPSGVWLWGQLGGLVGLGAFTLGLALAPEATLKVFWMGFVPLLPAVLLLHPSLWRNVCPLATLNTWSSRFGDRGAPGRVRVRRAWTGGIVLFGLLVAARHPLLNSSAPAVGALLLVAGGASVATGLRWGWKSGFCNTLCPMLPVERLYGHAPLVEVSNGRCDSCAGCSPYGCIDLSEERAVAHALGVTGSAGEARRTPFGVFVSAFPGVVVGFFLADGAPGATWAQAVGIIAAAGVLGGALTVLAARTLQLSWRTVVRLSAALAALAFYGLAADGLAEAWGLGAGGAMGIQVGALLLVTAWLLRARAPTRPERVQRF